MSIDITRVNTKMIWSENVTLIPQRYEIISNTRKSLRRNKELFTNHIIKKTNIMKEV